MVRIVMAFVLAFFLTSIVCAVYEGGGVATTASTAMIDDDDVTVTVLDTTGFTPTGVLFMEAEKVAYTGTDATHFTGLIRGYEDTTAAIHQAGIYVYSEDLGVLNAALGYNPAAIAASNGYVAIVMIPLNFFTITMPRLILWNFNFLNGDLLLIRYALITVSSAFYIGFAIILWQALKP